jgi:dehydrogenase/reductase SDR family protein 12
MHPGWADTAGVRNWMPVFRALTRPVIRTPEQGADTIVWLATAAPGRPDSGLLWHDRRARPEYLLPGTREKDPAAARKLWDQLERGVQPVEA